MQWSGTFPDHRAASFVSRGRHTLHQQTGSSGGLGGFSDTRSFLMIVRE
jgi:hypothetical protein